jgi:hypothetical protein
LGHGSGHSSYPNLNLGVFHASRSVLTGKLSFLGLPREKSFGKESGPDSTFSVLVSNQETSEGLAVECPVAFEPDILPEASLLGSRAVALGERLRLLSESSEIGTPLVRLASKQILKYYRRVRKPRGAPMKDSLILEAMEELGAPLVHFQSTPVAQFVVQSMPRASDVQEYSKTEKGTFLGLQLL